MLDDRSVHHEKRLNDTSAMGLRAAQYVRMSTDLQRYSTANQIEAISAFAASRNLEIVRTYRDEGRSGLRLGGRDALQKLISDVRTGNADFNLILVYDVSRWGRFQDADESAYYEFTCREAGIQVVYCAEQFENDGSMTSTILKNVKRAMAGEYSRELSTKVFIGQCRIIKLGFHRGGFASYGLRREMLDESGASKAIMERGQRKSLQTDRVVLRPGPQAEIDLVQRIFSSFVIEKKLGSEIAAELNAEGVSSPYGKKWSFKTIHKMLGNERYLGHSVFNRTSFKLQQLHVHNPPDMWIRRDNAFEAIIAPDLFARAQKIMARRRRRLTDQDLLDRLTKLWRRKGDLSEKIISSARGVPHASTYLSRFGSISAAYKLIGFKSKPRHRVAESKAKVKAVIETVAAAIVSNPDGVGGQPDFDSKTRLLTIDQRMVVSFRVAWFYHHGNQGDRRWYLKGSAYATPPVDFRSGFTLVMKMDMKNADVQHYYLLPTAQLALSRDRHVRMIDRVFSDGYRHDSLASVLRALIRPPQTVPP